MVTDSKKDRGGKEDKKESRKGQEDKADRRDSKRYVKSEYLDIQKQIDVIKI